MKIWKLEQTAHGKATVKKHNISDGCVVAATYSFAARKIAAEHAGDEGSEFWMYNGTSSCKMISGVASTRVKAGMIIHSYIHG